VGGEEDKRKINLGDTPKPPSGDCRPLHPRFVRGEMGGMRWPTYVWVEREMKECGGHPQTPVRGLRPLHPLYACTDGREERCKGMLGKLRPSSFAKPGRELRPLHPCFWVLQELEVAFFDL
jgi:hypothetical protein